MKMMIIMEMKKDQSIIPAQSANFQPEAHFHPAFPVSTECNRSEQAASLEPVERSRDPFQSPWDSNT